MKDMLVIRLNLAVILQTLSFQGMDPFVNERRKSGGIGDPGEKMYTEKPTTAMKWRPIIAYDAFGQHNNAYRVLD
jgi:hypothetical protein